MPNYPYYRCCTGLVGGFACVSVERRDKKGHCWDSVGAVGGSVDADWSLLLTCGVFESERFESDWLGMLISYPIINHAQ